MSKKLPVNGFRWLDRDEINEINEEFIKNYNENDNKDYIFEIDARYPKRLHDLHSGLAFLPERMEINKCKNSFVIYLTRKIRHTCKFIETSVKSWIKVKKDS